MFVEHKEQGEAVPVKVGTLKLSEAIRIGCPYVSETDLFEGCAIGTGYRARTGRDLSEDANMDPRIFAPYHLVAEAFGIPYDVVHQASELHYHARRTREGVADWLESQGY